MPSPYRDTMSKPRVAPQSPRLRVARAWVTGRLMRYGRQRTAVERGSDREFVLGLCTSSLGLLLGFTVYLITGLWGLMIGFGLTLTYHLATGVHRRLNASRHRPSLRARGCTSPRYTSTTKLALAALVAGISSCVLAGLAAQGPNPVVAEQAKVTAAVSGLLSLAAASALLLFLWRPDMERVQ